MKTIRISVLGSPKIWIDGDPFRFGCRKTEALIYYLAVNKEADRDELINLLWANKNESSGRKNLRQALYQIRRELDVSMLVSDGQYRVLLNPELTFEIDWDSEDPEIADKEEFLSFFYVKNCPEYELWIEKCRNEQQKRSLKGIRKKIIIAKTSKDLEMLDYWINTMLRLEPYSDGLVMEAMQTYVDIDHIDNAIRLYGRYEQLLREELEEVPSEELRTYCQTIAKNRNKKALGLPGKDFIYGRKEEMNQALNELMHFSRGEYGKSVLLAGESGIGKTTLWERLQKVRYPHKMVVFCIRLHPKDKKYSLKLFGDICREIYLRYQWGEITLTREQANLLDFLFFDLRRTENKDEIPPAENNRETISSQNFESHLEYLQMEHLILSLFHDISEKNRIILFIDDIQWMDSESLQLLYRILSDFSGNWIQATMTSHKNLSFEMEYVLMQLENQTRLKRIPLKPFHPEEIRQLLAEYYPDISGTLSAEELYRRTEGNPMMLMDLLVQYSEEGVFSEKIPERTRNVLKMRLRTLTEIQIQLLNALAFYDGSASVEELCFLVPMSQMQVVSELETLQKKHWIRERREDDRILYEFRRQIYCDYINRLQSEGKIEVWKRIVEKKRQIHG